jgi:hypothetical protein
VTDLLSALRSERKHIKEALRNLEQGKQRPEAPTDRIPDPLARAPVRRRHGPAEGVAESVTGLKRERDLTDPMRDKKVSPIRRDILASDEDREVADLAYDIWLSNGFRGGSPEEALMTAVRQSRTKTAAVRSWCPNASLTLLIRSQR